MRITPRTWLLAVIVLVALAVRLVGIDRGLPRAYEEAVPLKHAWTMAGWGDAPLDLNPHFFHYPSLTFYTQMIGQAAVFAGLRATGAAASNREVRIRYYTDPTPFYVTGRFISILFALFTVLAVAALARQSGVAGAGAAAALLLALNVFHVARSQMIEVDVPLTALVTLALVALARLASSPSRRTYLLAGLAIGLAASAKYTGALLVVPLVTAHVLARSRSRAGAGWGRLALALAAAGAAFAVTSPYVLIDFDAFRADLALERAHMRLGHFGGGVSTPAFYLRSLGQALIGWPALALSAAGVVAALARRQAWAIVSAAFVIAYAAAISTWAVAVDRYLLPVIPALLVFAVYGASAIGSAVARSRRAQSTVVAVAVAVILTPGLPHWREHRARSGVDSRTVALEWIETNIEPGSLVVSEAYGPPLFGPLEFWQVDADIRSDVYRRRTENGFRGLMPIPLFQTRPEDTAPYYDLSLYRGADVVVTTGAVRSRYEAAPERFPEQAAFYAGLDGDFELVYTVDAHGEGPRIFVYRSRRHDVPFAGRPAGAVPRLAGENLPPRWRAWFYYRLGLNYEAFGHLQRALESYERGWPDAVADSEAYRQSAYGIVRALRLLGRGAEIPARIAAMAALAPDATGRRFVETLSAAVSR